MVTSSESDSFPAADRPLRRALFVLFALTLAGIFAVFLPPLRDHARHTAEPTIIPDGAAQHIAPYLFADDDPDLISAYFRDAHPAGFRLLMRTVPSISAYTNLAPYVLLGLTLLVLAFGVKPLAGWGGVLVVTALSLSSDWLLGLMVGGTPRAFAPLIVAMTAAGLVRGLPGLVVLGTVGAALFYPALMVSSGFALVGALVLPASQRGCAKGWSRLRRDGLIVLVAGICVAATFPILQRTAGYGPTITPNQFAEFPEAGDGGRLAERNRVDYRPGFFASYRAALPTLVLGEGEPLAQPLRDILLHRDRGLGTPWRMNIFLGISLLFISAGFLGLCITHPGARRLGVYLIAIFFAVMLAQGLSPSLFLPDRHVGIPLPVLMILLIPIGLTGVARFFIGQAVSGWVKNHTGWMVNLLTVLFFGGFLVMAGNRVFDETGLTRTPREDVGLMLAINGLPGDVMVAGWPSVLDPVTVLTGRKVLVNHAVNLPYHQSYTEELRRRVVATIHSMYAHTPGPLLALADTWGVTHLVLVKHHYFRPPVYHAPYLFMAAVAMQQEPDVLPFVLGKGTDAVVYENGHYLLVDIRRIRDSGRDPTQR